MFTGIVTHIGRVRRVVPASRAGGDTRLEIEAGFDLASVPIGASIACAGCCLTVIEKGRGWFAVQASAETMGKTTLGDWQAGAKINLERPLKIGDELGGHIVAGHVDGVGRLVSCRGEGASIRLVFAAPRALGRFIASKGSVAVDGVSLTVNDVADKGKETLFGVNIIPHTSKITTLGALRPGGGANLEIDMLARYGARLAKATGRTPGAGRGKAKRGGR